MKRTGTVLALCLLALTACSFSAPSQPSSPRPSVMPGETITVKPNENIYGIAVDHGVSMRDLMAVNHLAGPVPLKPGQTLVLPVTGVSASALASPPISGTMEAAPLAPVQSAVQAEALPPIQTMPTTSPLPLAPAGNFTRPLPPAGMSPAYTPQTSQTVQSAKNTMGLEQLATPSALPPVKPVPTTVAPSTTSTVSSAAAAASSVSDDNDNDASPPSMVWPLQGAVLSGFGPKGQGVNNDGVNIAAPKGSPVQAAASGTVVYAGNDMKGFGNLVLIRHPGGWVTAYAYLDRILVQKQNPVAQGDMIGTVGKSGNVTTPQLHFEVRQGSKPVDPKSVIN